MRALASKLTRLPGQISALLDHPLNQQNRAGAVSRWLRWQIASRIATGPILVPFVNGTLLAAGPGETGITGNIFFGLAEYEDMAFALQLLVAGDLFVDAGCNAGSYSILAAGVRKAECIAIDPVASTIQRLQRNVRINNLAEMIEVRQCAVGDANTTLTFTSDLDTCNHVGSTGEGDSVACFTLDTIIGSRDPALIKIDVEGFEPQVLAGAAETLGKSSLLALIVEINSSFERYGMTVDHVLEPLIASGFMPFRYHPNRKDLQPLAGRNDFTGNTIFIRDLTTVKDRLSRAPDIGSFRFGTVSP